MSDDEDEDDDDSTSDDESTGVAGLSLGCLDLCTNYVDISWRLPLFKELYNMSREAASHPSDKAGGSRNTLSVPVDKSDVHKLVDEQSRLLLTFSAGDTDSDDDSEDEDEDEAGPELPKAIEAEVRS